MYFVIEGNLEVVKGGAKLAALKPGDLFGEMALFLREPRSASVVAKSEVKVLEVHRNEIQSFIENNVSVAFNLLETLCVRMRNLLKDLRAY